MEERCVGMRAGYGWQIGWYFEVAWQIFFTMDTTASLWVCAFLLLGALLGFAITLLSLYRRASCVTSTFLICQLLAIQGTKDRDQVQLAILGNSGLRHLWHHSAPPAQPLGCKPLKAQGGAKKRKGNCREPVVNLSCWTVAG